MSYAIIKHEIDSGWSIQIPYSGKLSRIGENMIFVEKTLADCSLLLRQRTPRPKISRRKLSQIATKPWNSRKFSPSKVSCYTVLCNHF